MNSYERVATERKSNDFCNLRGNRGPENENVAPKRDTFIVDLVD
jgi:hypothetical protein